MAVCALPNITQFPAASNFKLTVSRPRLARLSFNGRILLDKGPLLTRSDPLQNRTVYSKLTPNVSDEQPPASRFDALTQAGSSISTFLEKSLRKTGPSTIKQKKLQKQTRLRVELPVLDSSESSIASLLRDLISGISLKKAGNPTIIFSVFCNAKLLESFKNLGNPSLSNNQNEDKIYKCHDITDIENVEEDCQVVVILAPQLSELAYMEKLAKLCDPRPVLLVNPDWPVEDEPTEAPYGSFVRSFDVIYSYLPLVIQGFFGKTDGAVLKHVKAGAPAGRPWLIYVKEEAKMKCVLSLRNRPTAVDLENALYNTMAANSPITKSVKFLRGLVGKS